MPLNESQLLILAIYSIVFFCVVIFFEIRLNYIHARHIEKLWPVGEDGLRMIDRKLKIIVRILFVILFLLSVATILTLL